MLADGEVIRDIAALGLPVEEWRAELRRQARADRIVIRTGTTGVRVWAALNRPRGEAEPDDVERRFALVQHWTQVALQLRHDPRAAAPDGQASLLRCDTCAALGYVEASSEGFTGGALFEDACSATPSGS